jgi:geranylgeranyl diphosphate synthase, type II
MIYNYSQCLAIIQKEIERLAAEKKAPAELYEPVSYIMQLGGKRLRPVMVLFAHNLFNDAIEEALPVAMAIEVFHNFTLVHDDIMDNAPIRRSKATVHEKWDNNVAILSGDAMQIVAYQYLCKVRPSVLKSLIDIFNTTALEVCEGQQYDMNFASRKDVSLPEYVRMIELKTSVLVAASLKMGALSGGAGEQDAQNLYEFGRNLGMAFQIQDDYLDVYADQDVFGKTVGGDIAENKKTYLLIKAMELAQGEDKNILDRAIRNQIADIEIKIEMVRGVYDNLNIASIAQAAIEEYSNRAFCFLDAVSVDDSHKTMLREMAMELMKRER